MAANGNNSCVPINLNNSYLAIHLDGEIQYCDLHDIEQALPVLIINDGERETHMLVRSDKRNNIKDYSRVPISIDGEAHYYDAYDLPITATGPIKISTDDGILRLELDDIALVASETNVDMERVINAVFEHRGDIINAILELKLKPA